MCGYEDPRLKKYQWEESKWITEEGRTEESYTFTWGSIVHVQFVIVKIGTDRL